MNIEILDTTKRGKATIARSVAKLLLPAEDHIDRSIIAVSGLLAQIAQARIDLGLSASAGQASMQSAADGVTALLTAREGVVRCHSELVDIRDFLGLSAAEASCTWTSPSASAQSVERAAAA